MSDHKLAKYQPKPRPDIYHHEHEWSSGARGGGHVPDDFEWATNPKQWQEEYGANHSDIDALDKET